MHARFPGRLVFVALFALANAAPAQSPNSSLHKVPADAMFYSSSLRIGEQIDTFLKSNAYAKLQAMPAAKMALKHLMEQAHKPGNPLGLMMSFMHAPENQELHAVLHDMFRNEMFSYGGADMAKLLSLASEMTVGIQMNQMMMRMQGDNSPEGQLKALLSGMKDSVDDIVAPDIVFGFRSTKPDSVKNLLPRLEAALNKAMEKAPKELQGRLKREKIGDADAVVLSLDGSMVPWEKTKIEDLEDEKDEFKPLVDKLKALKVKVTLAVKGEYVLLCMGSDNSAIAKFGQGPALATLPEFAPLAKFADKRLVSISYTSMKFAEAMGTSPKDLADMVKQAKEGLESSPLSEELRGKIVKDLDAMFKEFEKDLPKPFATMGFQFLTDTGAEGYDYHFNTKTAYKPLTMTDNMGGTPLVALAGRGEDATPAYKKIVKWLKVFYGHGEAAAEEMGFADQVKGAMEQAMPFLQRFDEITGGLFLPSLADAQGGLVLDSKWSSKKWFPELDQEGSELPMLEVGFLFGVSDAEKLVESFKGYRKLVNDLLDVARTFGGGMIPEDGMPAPKTQAVGTANAFYWPVPPMGQDPAIQPNIAVSKSMMSISMSMQHATRLHTNKPLVGNWKALANGNAIHEIAWVDFAGLMKTARPWVEKLGVPALLKEVKDNAPEGLRKEDIPAQVATLLDVLGCLKSAAAVTYRDGANTVTHSVTVVEDIKK